MRLWHYELLPYLPDAQFKGQLSELVAIMHDWRDKGKTNHLLINRVMEYPKNDFARYSELGIFRLASRINDLKNKGYKITGQMVNVENRFGETIKIKKYFMEQENGLF